MLVHISSFDCEYRKLPLCPWLIELRKGFLMVLYMRGLIAEGFISEGAYNELKIRFESSSSCTCWSTYVEGKLVGAAGNGASGFASALKCKANIFKRPSLMSSHQIICIFLSIILGMIDLLYSGKCFPRGLFKTHLQSFSWKGEDLCRPLEHHLSNFITCYSYLRFMT